MSPNRKLRVALVILGMTTLLLAMSVAPASAAHGDLSGLYGGALRVAVKGPIGLNPFTATDTTSWNVIPLVYDSLARIDPVTLLPSPWAAASWSISGASLTVTLRTDLKFHDGSSLTAADVVYSYNQYKAAGRAPTDLAVSSSGNSVTLSSATAGGLLYGQGLTLPIVKTGTVNNPVGSGPFELQSSTSTSWTLVANADHFRPPYLETVTFSVYTNTTTAGLALLSGNVDFIGWPLSVDEVGIKFDVGGVNKTLLTDANTIANPGLRHLVVGFNMDAARATNDFDLRMAMAKGLNPALASQATSFGTLYPSTRTSQGPIIREDVPWFNPAVPVYQVTINAIPRSTALLTESLQMLDEAGYLDRNGDGIREAPDGSPLSLTMVAIPQVEDTRTFVVEGATQDVFGRMGLQVNLVQEPSSTLPARLVAGNFDVFFSFMDTELDPGFLWDWYHSAGATNYMRVRDSTLDGYVTAANAAVDPSARETQVFNAQLRAMEQAYSVPMFYLDALESVVRGSFDGWVNMASGINNFWTYMNLHVTQEGPLTASLTVVPLSVKSGQTATAVAKVVDQEGIAVAGATLSLWMGGTQIASGVTTSTGTLSFSVTAPTVDGPTDVELTLQASAPGYGGTSTSSMLTVAPDTKALSVAIVSDKVTVASGDDATITVTVTAGGAPVANAEVVFDVVGIGGSLTTVTDTTNAAGQVATTFSADVGPRTQFRILATASLDGYTDGLGSTTVVVEQRVGSIEARGIPGLDMYAIVIAIVAIVVIAALAFWAGRRR